MILNHEGHEERVSRTFEKAFILFVPFVLFVVHIHLSLTRYLMRRFRAAKKALSMVSSG